MEEIPERVDRVREAGTRNDWDGAGAEAASLDEEAAVLQIEPLRRATSALVLATDARDWTRLDQAVDELLEARGQLTPEG